MKESTSEQEQISRIKNAIKIENLRRILLGAGIFLAAAIFFWASTEPYLSVSQVREKVGFLGRKPTYDAVLAVSGESWEEFFKKTNLLFENLEVPKEWRANLREKELKEVDEFLMKGSLYKPKVYSIFLKADEKPFSELSGRISPEKSYLLKLNDTKSLSLYSSGGPEIHSLGEGITNLPESFSYPVRKYWFIPFNIALLAYLFLPRRKRLENELFYTKASWIGVDLVSMILFIPFVVLPFVIAGSTQHAFSSMIILTAVLWIFVIITLVLFYYGAYYASYSILVGDDFMALNAPGISKSIKLSDIVLVQPVIQGPPKWLSVALLFAGLFGSGGLRYAALGQSISISTMETFGLKIYTKSGDCVYLWGASTGMDGLKNWKFLEPVLAKAPYTEEVARIYGILPVNEEKGVTPPEVAKSEESQKPGG